MKELPTGNWAMAIAHPGHELRLHGFMEKAKPFVFILTDNSEAKGDDLMWDSIKAISRAAQQGMNIRPEQAKEPFMRKVLKMSLGEKEEKAHIKDSQISFEAANLHTTFFKHYIDFMVQKLIEFKITHLVCDASEEHHLSHEIMRMLCDLAIMKVKHRTGDDIVLYDFPLSQPYDSVIHEHCINIQLNEQMVQRKLHAVCVYPGAIADLEPNIKMDIETINKLRMKKEKRPLYKIIGDFIYFLLVLFQFKDRKKVLPEEQFVFLKKALLQQNEGFFYNEIIRPAKIFKQTDNYKAFIQPIYGKLLQEITQ